MKKSCHHGVTGLELLKFRSQEIHFNLVCLSMRGLCNLEGIEYETMAVVAARMAEGWNKDWSSERASRAFFSSRLPDSRSCTDRTPLHVNSFKSI